MKKFLIFVLILLLFAAAGVGYFFWWKNSRVNLWTFVPDTSIAVFQPVDLGTLLSKEEDRKVLINLKKLPDFAALLTSFSELDSLGRKLDASGNLFDNVNILISMHPGDKSALSIANLYLIEVDNLRLHDYFGSLADYMVTENGFVKSERLYQGYQINEFKSDELELAYIFYKNYLIASFSPFLVDDAIRMLEKDKSSLFTEDKELSLSVSQNLVGEGRLYVNNKQMAKLISRLVNPDETDLSSLQWFSNSMYMDLTIDQDKIDLTGFSVLDTASVNYLSAYQGIRGVGFEMKTVIPDHASIAVHISFEDIMTWHEGLKNYWRKHDPSYLTRMGEMENKYGFDTQAFYGFTDQEIGMFVLDSKRTFVREKIMCIKHNDRILSENFLRDLAKSTNKDLDVSLDNYAGRMLGLIKIADIPARLFGEPFKGFAESYYFVNADYIFLANSQHALEVLIDDIDNENTWRKSVKTNTFLESTNDDANFSIYAKGIGFWSMIEDNLNDEWAEYLADNELVFNQLEYAVMQFTNVDENFYSNISFYHPGNLLESQEPKDFKLVNQTSFGKQLISKPYAVRNHNNRALEMMVQDAAFNLHLVSSDLKELLTIPLKEAIVSPIYQVDYYKNGKLQYLFAQGHSLHIIDRTGTYIPGFPVKVPSDQPVKYLSLIDYDKSKDYRILVATQRSFYYMYDKRGKRLKGWNPKKLTGSPVMGGQHMRVRSTDFMIFLQDNGIVHALNRQGVGKKGFPIDLKGNISSSLNLNKGGSLSSTELVAVTNTGELIEFNLLGGAIRRDQFYKENLEEVFKLVNSNDGKEYVVAKKSSNKIAFFNENLELLFETSLSSENYEIQYYYFEGDNDVLVLVDSENALTYLYNMNGHVLHVEPLGTGYKLAMLYHESRKTYEIFCSVGNNLKKITINQ